MSERADDIRIESDEDGFHLIVEVTDDEGVELLDFLIPYPETFYKRVRYEIEPWLREKKAARKAGQAFSSVPALKAAIREGIEALGDNIAYELNDPKHPTYHDRHADIWDARDKVMDAVDEMERGAFGSAIVSDAMNESTKEEA